MDVVDLIVQSSSSSLGGVSVQFDGVAAPLVSVSATQVIAIVPYEVAGEATTQMQLLFTTTDRDTVPSRGGADASGPFLRRLNGGRPGARSKPGCESELGR